MFHIKLKSQNILLERDELSAILEYFLTLLTMVLMTFTRGVLSYDREIKDLTFYYKCRYGLIDLDTNIFTPIVSSRTRRGSSMYLQTPFCKTSTFKTSYFNRIVHLWNLILKLAPSCIFATLSSFKTFLYRTYKELLTTTFDPDLPCTYSLCRKCPCHS